jgi:hypothetical protein
VLYFADEKVAKQAVAIINQHQQTARPSLLTLSNINEQLSDNEPGSSSYKSDLRYFLPHLEDDSPNVRN